MFKLEQHLLLVLSHSDYEHTKLTKSIYEWHDIPNWTCFSELLSWCKRGSYQHSSKIFDNGHCVRLVTEKWHTHTDSLVYPKPLLNVCNIIRGYFIDIQSRASGRGECD